MKGRAILICGKIASGKSFYAERLRLKHNAAVLSCDEIMLALFGGDAGEMHDEYSRRTREFLFKKSLELIETGQTVILEWGFWQKKSRAEARAFYESRGIPCEMHYINVSDADRTLNINSRNRAVAEGKASAYFVDEGLAAKAAALFEEPATDEIDILFYNAREN